MQATAFAAAAGGAHDQIGHRHQIAQLDQIGGDAIIAVIILHFLAQVLHAVGGAFQPLFGAHNATIIPHGAAQLVPIVGDHHIFIAVGHPAFIPGLHFGQRRAGGLRADIVGHRLAKHQTFQQRV